MTKLYIDDIRNPIDTDFVIVRSYNEAIHWIRLNGCPEYISFDHDLGAADERTGYDIAKWLVERDLDAPGKIIPTNFKFNVHSANPVGAANIAGLLNNYLDQR
jgi:hypothetical protein